jgi:hypothetical protein
MPSRCLRWPAVAVAFLWTSSALAQVNTEPLRKRIKARGFSALVEAALAGRTGNSEGIAADGTGGVGWATDPHLAFVFASADYSRFNETTQVNKTFAHARYNYEFAPRLWGELFAQAQSDQFQRLKLRNLLGVGPRVAVVLHPNVDLFVGTAYMLERDVIDVAPGASDERDQLAHRSSTYVSAHLTLDERITLATTTYVQPKLDDFSNVRLLSESAVIFKVTDVLSASLHFNVRYDSDPPTAVLPTDTELKNSLRLSL